jgi:hypothetical protein
MNRTGSILTSAGTLAPPLTNSARDRRLFAVDPETVTCANTQQEDGRFKAKPSETMLWGGVIDHSLTAICRLDTA